MSHRLDHNNFELLFCAVFCCVAALAIGGALHHVDKDLLGWWLCERQVKAGGLNGRPEKLPDVSCLTKSCLLQTPEGSLKRIIWSLSCQLRFVVHIFACPRVPVLSMPMYYNLCDTWDLLIKEMCIF
jgi:hypothetical protein